MFKLEPDFFGLDISDFSLKFAKLKKRKNSSELVSYGEEKIPKGIIENGQVKDGDGLARLINGGLEKSQGEKIKTNYVALSLPEERSFLDVIQIPLMEKEEIKTAVYHEIENHIPLKLDKVNFDFQKIPPLSKNQNYQEILMGAVPKAVVETYLKALEKSKLKPVFLEVESLSIVRSLIKKTTFRGSLLIIDFGGSRTSFINYLGKSLRFTSSFPLSSSDLTDSLSNKFKISFEDAEVLKIKEGLEGEREIKKVLVDALGGLVKQIKIHLNYYCSYERERQTLGERIEPEKILLCGNGANLKGLPGFLSSKLNIDVQIGDPLINILNKNSKSNLKMSSQKSLGYTTALGLALKNIYDD